MFSRLTTYALLLLAAACATAGSTFRSGVGDRFLEHPPYYAGASLPAGARLLVVPVRVEHSPARADVFDPAVHRGSAVGALLAELNLQMDSIAMRANAIQSRVTLPRRGPFVFFGCEEGASGDCVERGDSVLGRRGTTMRLALERPSAEWIAAMRALLDSAGATHALLVSVQGGQYWTRQRGLRGDKSVELGSGHTVQLPWLTSLETPVSVIQLTGAIVDRDGRGVRVGAEGILARRTPLAASGVGLQRMIADEDVRAARTTQRSDLPGAPRAVHQALVELVRGLGVVKE